MSAQVVIIPTPKMLDALHDRDFLANLGREPDASGHLVAPESLSYGQRCANAYERIARMGVDYGGPDYTERPFHVIQALLDDGGPSAA